MIAAYQGISPISRIIRWQTRSTFSHVSWVTRNGENIEAWHRGGVREQASVVHNHTPGTAIVLFEVYTPDNVPLTSEQSDAVTEWMRSQCGKGYDFRSVARFLTRRDQHPNDRAKWFCSELVYTALQEAINLDLLARTLAYEVSPGMLVRSPYLSVAATTTVRC